MAEIHVYKGGTTDALDGTLVSEDDSGLSAVAIQSVAAGQAVHIRCSPGYQTAASVYIVPPDRFEVSKDNSTYVAATLDLGVVDDDNFIFYVKQTTAFGAGDDNNVRFFVDYGGSFVSIPAAPIFDMGPTVYDVTSNSCKIAASFHDPNGDAVTATYRVVARGAAPNWTGAAAFVSPQGVSSLTAGTPYDVYVRITDGTLATVSAPQPFTTGAIGNSAPSSFTPTVGSITASTAAVTFSTTDVDGDTLTYRVAVTTSAVAPTDWSGYSNVTSPYSATGLSAHTNYYAHVRAFDGALSTVGTSAQFTTANTVPAAFSITATTIGTNSVVVSGTTTDPDGDTVTYKYKAMVAASAAPSTTDAVWNTAASYVSPQTVSALTASTSYKVHVRANDGFTGYRVATTAAFTTDPALSAEWLATFELSDTVDWTLGAGFAAATPGLNGSGYALRGTQGGSTSYASRPLSVARAKVRLTYRFKMTSAAGRMGLASLWQGGAQKAIWGYNGTAFVDGGTGATIFTPNINTEYFIEMIADSSVDKILSYAVTPAGGSRTVYDNSGSGYSHTACTGYDEFRIDRYSPSGTNVFWYDDIRVEYY